jgi:hypothetical protein
MQKPIRHSTCERVPHSAAEVGQGGVDWEKKAKERAGIPTGRLELASLIARGLFEAFMTSVL